MNTWIDILWPFGSLQEANSVNVIDSIEKFLGFNSFYNKNKESMGLHSCPLLAKTNDHTRVSARLS